MNRFAGALLQIVLAPVLVTLFYFVHNDIALYATHLCSLVKGRPLILTALMVGSVVAAVTSAAIFAYPIGRIYGRLALPTALLICGPTVARLGFEMTHSSGRPFVIAAYALEILALLVFVPLGAWLMAIRRSQIAMTVIQKPEAKSAPC